MAGWRGGMSSGQLSFRGVRFSSALQCAGSPIFRAIPSYLCSVQGGSRTIQQKPLNGVYKHEAWAVFMRYFYSSPSEF